MITAAIPSGATGDNIAVRVTIRGTAKNGTISHVNNTGAVLDDVEGGSVGTFKSTLEGFAQSGYYAYGTGITPNNAGINANGPQTSAVNNGLRGMRVTYSYASDWGGGWGATMSNVMDLSSYPSINFFIKWDGSANDLKFGVKDRAGHVYVAAVSNATLRTFTSYGQVRLDRLTNFVEDTTNTDRTPGAIDWTQITDYSFTYTSRNTTVNAQNIDSITAGEVNLGSGEVVVPPISGEVQVDQLVPSAGPAGTRFQALGTGFGDSQGRSILIFQNDATGINYPVEIRAWSNTTIEALVPELSPIGTYTVKVVKQSISSGGTLQVMESNPQGFSVTAGVMGNGIAIIYPNPFNPLSTDPLRNRTNISGWAGSGATNVGVYIFDSTAKLVYQNNIVAAIDTTWDGKDSNGSYAADGLYLLRVVNEDTKATLAKGKILVIKRN
jgi:hypothetical protein